MEPCYTRDPWRTSWPFYVWTTPIDTQPMACYQTSWRDFPRMFFHEAPHYYAGVWAESSFCNPDFKRPNPRESRKFFLDRSVYDLVAAYPQLALTDSRLLGWYLRLSPEDRKLIQEEGGFHQFLHRHPALEMHRHHVHVKDSSSPAQSAVTANQHAFTTGGAEMDGCETPSTHLDLEMLPSRENLTLLGCNWNEHQEKLFGQAHMPGGFSAACSSPVTQKTNDQKACYRPGLPLCQLNEDRCSFQTGSCAAVCKKPAGSVSVSLDMELKLCRQRRKPEPWNQISGVQGQSADFSPSQSEWPMATKESLLDSSSTDRIQMIGPEYTDGSIMQAVEPEQDQSDTFHSLMEDDKSILVCLANDSLREQNRSVHSCPVTTNNDDTAEASSETLRSYESATKVKSVDKHTSPMPCVSTCDAMIGTEVAQCLSIFTQTEDLETADKHFNTEVRMADLDYLAKEFLQLKKTQEGKEKKSVGCKLRNECECMERAQQAELALLALQYSICRQHCWRLYHTSAEGNHLTQVAKDPPSNIILALQKLELDYNEMKSKIQAGLPLQQLKPLSVDSGEILTGSSYIPAQMIREVLGEISSWYIKTRFSQEKLDAPSGDGGRPDAQSRKVGQEEEKRLKNKNENTRRAATLIPQDGGSAGQEVNTGEKWYDAEEELELPEDDVATAVRQDPTLVTAHLSDVVFIPESASEEARSSVLCVSKLPSNVTESDMMLLFDKYHPTEVSISALKDLRFAIVMLSGPQSAETAVKELNGCRMQGRALHLEHISRPTNSSQNLASEPDSSQNAPTRQTSKTDSSSTESTLVTPPPVRPSIRNRKVVCISPTAKGTFVPPHYGTMSSFDTLMAELTQLHPEVGRQRIVDAMIELRAKHQGVLCGMPLRTIREMISDLLTRPQTAKQS
ncbi:RNA-binding protein 44 isoform X2 [Oreochromis niloticus]|uniref:RNA-binding protein 44 isoform X2 n=1 Tax=Oreochromis niloticus TaxID=8128 RepID=UPI00039464C6|nr:RNA-binding protein 44 isoform X2 [Oreochromis niloticus]